MKKIYEIGTLKYSFLQMMLVFFWMLWGTFAMSVLATVFNVSVPFLLRDNGMSDAFIVVMLSSVVGIMNMIMNPILSFNSDRCRSRLGRRIPFILYTAVPLGVAMAALPYYPQLAALLPEGGVLGISFKEIFFAVGIVFYVFNWLFIGALFFYLIPDVIPVKLMGRFYGVFRVAGILAGVAYNKYIFTASVENAKVIYPIVGISYAVSIIIMCIFVKEGQYPPPAVISDRQVWYRRLAGAVKTYAKDCFSQKYYWWYYMIGMSFGLSGCINVFWNFFYTDGCQMSLQEVGNIGVILGVVGFISCFCAGFVVDKFGGFTVAMISLFMMGVFDILGGMLIHDYTTALIWRIPLSVFSSIYAVTGGRILVEVFPRTRFGQFCAAQAMFISLISAIIAVPVGKLSDFMKNISPDTTLMIGSFDVMNLLRGYRFVNFWQAVCFLIAMTIMMHFYFSYQKKRTDKAEDL